MTLRQCLRTGCSAGGSPHSLWARILRQGVSPCHRFLPPLHLLTTGTYSTFLQSRPAPAEPHRGSGAPFHSTWRCFASGELAICNISALSHTGLRRQWSCLRGSILLATSEASQASNGRRCKAYAMATTPGGPLRWAPLAVAQATCPPWYVAGAMSNSRWPSDLRRG